MSNSSSSFVGDIPEHYESGLGPNIFVDYAEMLSDLCCNVDAKNVIELAAGTGILSRVLRNKLPANSQLIVTDLNQPMLDVAKSKFSEEENVEFRVANAMDLPFGDDAFDLIVCQFGVMFFPDKPVSYREAARVLKPGGRYVFNVWSAMSENPFAIMAQDVGTKFFPDDPPGFYRVPFHYGNPEEVQADLESGGWSEVEHETIQLNKTIANPEAFAAALVYGNPLIDEIRERGGVDPREVVSEMQSALRATFGSSGMTMPLSATTFDCRMS